MAQICIVILITVLHALEKNAYSAGIGWNVLQVSNSSSWLVVLFKSSISLLTFSICVLLIVGRRVLKSLSVIVNLPIPPYCSITF